MKVFISAAGVAHVVLVVFNLCFTLNLC